VFVVPLKASNRSTEDRGARKVDALVAPLEQYVRGHGTATRETSGTH
jgi:hypothetical protein